MRNRYISQSAIKDFISCNKRYYYRVNFAEEAVSTIEMTIGTIIHKILEDSWNDKAKAIDLAYKLSLSYSLNKTDINTILLLVNNYFENFKSLVTEDDIIEYNFTVPYKDNIYITGKFDRINQKGNHLVIDWKTGNSFFGGTSTDIQSIIYYNSYKQLSSDIPTLMYAFLKDNKLVRYTPDQTYIDVVYNEIIPDMIEAIRLNSFPHQGLFNNSCKRCSFKNICFKELGKENNKDKKEAIGINYD